jgi:hypothetical protein
LTIHDLRLFNLSLVTRHFPIASGKISGSQNQQRIKSVAEVKHEILDGVSFHIGRVRVRSGAG